MGDDAGTSDGSAGNVRQSRPRGSTTRPGQGTSSPENAPVGKAMATPNRSDLTFSHAFDISNNPLSKRSTVNEKIAIGGQSLINLGVPGAGTLIGLARAAVMTQGSTTPAAPSKSGRGANKGGSGGAAARSLYGANPFGSGSSGRTLQNSAPDQVSPFGDDGGNEDLFKLGTNGPAPSAAPKTAASEATSIAKSIAQQQTDAALKKRRQIGGFSLFGSGGSGGSGFLS